MSILNTHIARDRALIVVDTAAGPGGEVGEASKIACFPHANVVLAARGEIFTFGLLTAALNLALLPNYDCIVEHLSQALAAVMAQRQSVIDTNSGIYPFAGLEIACIGYSHALGRMEGLRMERWPDQSNWKTTRIDPWSLSPNPGYMPDHAPDTEARMIEIALHQVAEVRQLPAVVVGGKLLLAEITKDAVSIRTVADLDAASLKSAA